MKLTRTQNAALTAGIAITGVGLIVGLMQDISNPATSNPTADCAILQPNEQRGCVGRGDDGHLVMLFPRSGPCYTCGAPAEVWIVSEKKGITWHVPSTEPGTFKELGIRYCPAGEICKVYNIDPKKMEPNS